MHKLYMVDSSRYIKSWPLWCHNGMFVAIPSLQPGIFCKVGYICKFCQKQILFGKFEVNQWKGLSFDSANMIVW